ncbi:uncharacterized protein LOC106641757 [Copidosoma floridanum]|uniref:uncharacterized protein LOC106641757 n=1 Tax=Copidosoma floridanum TaxID=29053 RepID=UPI0006C99848|nr:uncharacterized protein LOC106641757 [Copidosoma floridanum]
MTTTMATSSRTRLFSDAETGIQDRDMMSAGAMCAAGIVALDAAVAVFTKTRETSTNTRAAALSARGAETVSIRPETGARPQSRGTQCFGASLLSAAKQPSPAVSTKSTQSEPQKPVVLWTKSTQCAPETKPKLVAKGTQSVAEVVPVTPTSAKAVQCSVKTRDRGTRIDDDGTIREPLSAVVCRNKEVQTSYSQLWSPKLRLSKSVSAQPSTAHASTETTDESLSLRVLRHQELAPPKRSIAVGVSPRELSSSVSRATETPPAPVHRDFGTSPRRKVLVDVSVGPSLPGVFSPSSTNYCDECKQIGRNLTDKSGAKTARSIPTRIPVMSAEAKAEMRRAKLVRQDTWTGSLDQLGDESQSLDKHADRALSALQSSDNKQPDNDGADHQPQQQQESNDSVATKKQAPAEVSNGAQDEDELVRSMVLEAPKTPGPRPPMELSREMKAALKVLDDNLRKVSNGSTLASRVKNASNIVQHEWFKVSSTALADPHSVEFYLDQFEQHSGDLLHHVVNLMDSSGNTAMHYAVSHANFDVVSILLDSKVCDVNKSNNAGYTPVMLAALAQVRNSTNASVIKRLFQMADVNVRARLHGQTALMLAVSHGRIDMTRLLLDAGAAINLQDEDGSTALMCAAEHGHGDIVRLLLGQPDCDSSIVDVDGSSALKIALEAGHAEIGVLLYARQRANRASPMPGQGSAASTPPLLPGRPSAARRQRTTSSSSSGHHHLHHHSQHHHAVTAVAAGHAYSALSMSAPASPVATASRKFHSSSLSLVDSTKFSL